MTHQIAINLDIAPVPVDWQDRLVTTQYDSNSNLIVRSYGKSHRELYEAHLNRDCDAFCPFCVDEAEEYYRNPLPGAPDESEPDDDDWEIAMPLHNRVTGKLYPSPDAEDIPF